MNLPNKQASDLLGKDKQKARLAASHIISTPDTEAWKCLLENSEYLFTYIKDRAGQYLIDAANQSNFRNLFTLMKLHSPDWDYCIAEALRKNSSEDLNKELLNILVSGNSEEKSYAAKYFSIVAYDDACDALFIAVKEDCAPLKTNAAQALGKINDKESYNYFIKRLDSDDDWEKVESAEFLSNYGNKEAVTPLLRAMVNSNMAEYIAGEIASLVNLPDLLVLDDETQLLALEAFDNILTGTPEIWSLSSLLDFNVYEFVERLMDLSISHPESDIIGKYAQILLKAKSKFTLLTENSEYTYDEEKPVLAEIEEIHNLLASGDKAFWKKQLENINKELKVNDRKRKLAAISVISENEILDSVPFLLDLISCPEEPEIIICETFLTLSKLNQMPTIENVDCLLARIKDQNLLAIIQNSLTYSG